MSFWVMYRLRVFFLLYNIVSLNFRPLFIQHTALWTYTLKRTHNKYSHGKDVQHISSSSCHLKVGLQNVDSSRKRFMTTATEQGNTSVEQDCGNQRSIGNASQAFNTALKTPCTRSIGKKVEIRIFCQSNLKFFQSSALWKSIIAFYIIDDVTSTV